MHGGAEVSPLLATLWRRQKRWQQQSQQRTAATVLPLLTRVVVCISLLNLCGLYLEGIAVFHALDVTLQKVVREQLHYCWWSWDDGVFGVRVGGSARVRACLRVWLGVFEYIRGVSFVSLCL